MQLTIAEGRALAERAMSFIGHDPSEAAIIADHLIESELSGRPVGGLDRALTIVERLSRPGYRRVPINVAHETPVSALLAGGNNVGYLVARRAIDLAIEKAKQTGVAVVGCNDTYMTGMLSYYADIAARADMVSMLASNASPWVAPHGGAEGRFGTNPICFGFPCDDQDPVIWDIATSSMNHSAVLLAQRLGRPLPDGVGFDKDGNPTNDPAAAINGSISVWGGHRGSGLAVVVALLGAMADAPAMPLGMVDYGCLFVVMRPDLLMPAAAYKAKVSEYAAVIRSTKPVPGGARVRMPNDRRAGERRKSLERGTIEIADVIHEKLIAAISGNGPVPEWPGRAIVGAPASARA